jgi:hypothetical protein
MTYLDIFGEPEPEPEPSFPVHTITVTSVVYEEPSPLDIFGIDPIEEYVIDHGECELRGDECTVEGIVTDIGLHQSIFGVWDTTHRLETKAYRVRGWVGHSPATPNGPEEWDAGIEEVDDDE